MSSPPRAAHVVHRLPPFCGAVYIRRSGLLLPFCAFFILIFGNLAAMFPMGGAAVVAVRMGRGDMDGANHAFMTALSLTALLSIALMVVGMVFSQQIVDVSGAGNLSEGMRKMSSEYLFYYSAFSVPMLMSTCLSVFVRNDGSPALSFAGMREGAAANIFWDWLFIFPFDMGMIGAAGLGQLLSVLVLLSHFVRKKGKLRIQSFKADFSLMRKICRRGVPEAVTQLAAPVTALCYTLYTLMSASLLGEIGVSAFRVLSFISSLANAILSGVAQGLQPLRGHCYGKQDTEAGISVIA